MTFVPGNSDSIVPIHLRVQIQFDRVKCWENRECKTDMMVWWGDIIPSWSWWSTEPFLLSFRRSQKFLHYWSASHIFPRIWFMSLFSYVLLICYERKKTNVWIYQCCPEFHYYYRQKYYESHSELSIPTHHLLFPAVEAVTSCSWQPLLMTSDRFITLPDGWMVKSAKNKPISVLWGSS